MRQLENPDA
jgi:hypothetical protein